MTRTFVSLKERNFRYLTLSTVGIGMGMWFQMIGLAWLMKVITESPTQQGFLGAVQGVTVLIATPVGGVLSDRMSRRSLIVVVTALTAIQALILAFLVYLDQVQVWHLYAFGFLNGITGGINQPTRQAFIYDISSRENITNAISLNSMVQSLTRVIGPNIAGALIGFVGIASCFFTLAAMSVGAAMATFMISASSVSSVPQKRESAITSFVGGIRYSCANPVILALILLTSIMPLLVYPYIQFLPYFADVFNSGPQGYGLLASAIGFGAIPAGLVIATLGNFRGKGVTMTCAYLGYIAMLILFTRQDAVLLGVAFLMAAGAFHSIATTLLLSLLQLWVRNDMRGRVISLQNMASGLTPLGAVPMGLGVDKFGPQNTVGVFCSLAFLSVAFISVLAPQIRREPDALPEESQVSTA